MTDRRRLSSAEEPFADGRRAGRWKTSVVARHVAGRPVAEKPERNLIVHSRLHGHAVIQAGKIRGALRRSHRLPVVWIVTAGHNQLHVACLAIPVSYTHLR